jgi:hypothetical protein
MLQPSDMTAITDPCLDNNGDTCALVKIITDDLIGLEFDNTEQYVKARTIGKGSYEVYMPYLLNKLSYNTKNICRDRLIWQISVLNVLKVEKHT